MSLALNIIPTELLNRYVSEFNNASEKEFEQLSDSKLSIDTFSFYTSVSAVFSSKIEGEAIELDSFVKYKRFGVEYQPDYTRKIDDLYEAYLFAQKNRPTAQNIALAQAQITKHILKKSQQGKIRAGNMFVITKDGEIEYVAAAPEFVNSELEKLYQDIDTLLNTNLTFSEVLFFASMIHLVFVKIHPFYDGNGRTARLLEKWFMGQKLGSHAWFVQSERNYYENHQTYYNNIRRLGLEYEELDYKQALPFLLMLPRAIKYDE